MKKLMVVFAVLFVAFAFMATGAMAGGSVYANKIVGGTGMTYDLDVDETFGKVNAFAGGDFSSDVDGVTDINTDEIEGGVKFSATDAIKFGMKYSENYRSSDSIELLTADMAYTFGNGFSMRAKNERNVKSNDDTAVLGVGYEW